MKRIKCIFALLRYSMADAPFSLERFFPIFSLLVEGVLCAFVKITSSDLPSHRHLPSFEGWVSSSGVSRGTRQPLNQCVYPSVLRAWGDGPISDEVSA